MINIGLNHDKTVSYFTHHIKINKSILHPFYFIQKKNQILNKFISYFRINFILNEIFFYGYLQI